MEEVAQPAQHPNIISGATVVSAPQTVVVPHQPQLVVQGSAGCCNCQVPQDTHEKATYHLSIAVIVTHAIALVIFGFFFWGQWIASLCGIIPASLALGIRTKAMYIVAGIFYFLAAIFDLLMMLSWFAWEDEDGENSVAWIGIFPLLALLAAVPASVMAFTTCGKVEQETQLPIVGITQPPGVQMAVDQ